MVPIFCSIHPWMTAWAIVRKTPHFAISANDGTFKIAKLPYGEHAFQLWHEGQGLRRAPNSVQINGKTQTLEKGLLTLKIDSPTLDVGEIKLTIE